MSETSRPWNGTITGDSGSYSDQQWHQAWRGALGFGASDVNVGPVRGNDDGTRDCLWVRANSPAAANVIVSPGTALVRGIFYSNDADVTLAIAANASGNARIDTIILRADFTAQTVRLAVRQGTPAATPVAPTLTQTDGVQWEIPLADVAVANGFSSIAQSDIRVNAHFSNLADGVYYDNVLNNTAGVLRTGDVVIFDTSANRAVTTVAQENHYLVAGVWVGRTAAGGRGRVQVGGIGLVYVNAAVSFRDAPLNTSPTAGQAMVVGNNPTRTYILGYSLETTSGAGLCLARITPKLIREATLFVGTSGATIANTTTETTLMGTGSGTLTVGANEPTVGKAIRITMAGILGTNSANTNFTIRLKLGSTTIASITGTLPTSQANNPFWLEAILTWRTVGGSGTVIGQIMFLDSVGSANRELYGSALTATVTIDTTTSQLLDVSWQWTTANANNTITETNATAEFL